MTKAENIARAKKTLKKHGYTKAEIERIIKLSFGDKPSPPKRDGGDEDAQ